ncbi:MULTISPECIES: hypothetical protein [Methylobacterium]|uniref:hypothetical protein n=1 Tax=Methylobacterium TaxID=407 RepID=UPI000B1A16CE|nr:MULTISPECIES: hypothetical protein [Methylobacterium]MCI9881695.1 hypothetical protein [Methylobacterium goesingense]
MIHRRLTAALAIALGLSASGALAQSYNAPAGIPAAVAPGGLEGQAGARNVHELRDGRARAAVSQGYQDEIGTGSVRARRGDRW